MRWFRKCGLLLAAAVCTGTLLSGYAEDAPPVKKKKDKSERAEKKKKKDPAKDEAKNPPNEGEPAAVNGKKLSLPLVEGHDSLGLKIPYYDAAGKLQMMFIIGLASRLEGDKVRMKETQVETYKEDGSPDLQVELPTSVLDLNTRVVSSQVRTTIRREDFELKGDAVEFDTANKQGKLVGNVRMLIYDLNEEVGGSPEKKPNE